MDIKNVEHPVDAAARVLGGRSALAEKLDLGVSAIGNWKRIGVPPERAIQIERLTLGQVTCERLCPGVDWAVLRGTAAPVHAAQPAAPP
ncbi:MAG: Cro/CI family transcriptional regulator [Burkholderiaceae bacterium]